MIYPAASWTTVLVSALLAFALKYAGYLVPARHLQGLRTAAVTALLPVALLSALLAVQSFTGSDGGPVVDARAGGLAVAVVALVLRAPFLLVVILAAVTAAVLRAAGLAA